MQLEQLALAYFSPTGHTQSVLRILAPHFSLPTSEIDLTAFHNNDQNFSFSDRQLVLLGVPSYGGRVPAPAAERIARLRGNHTPTIIVVTFGNRDYDDTLSELYDLVHFNGMNVIAGIAAVTEHSIVSKFGTGRPDSSDRIELAKFADQIKQSLTCTDSLPEIGDMIRRPKPYRHYNGIPIKPLVNKNCVSCGQCTQACPVHAIPDNDPAQTDDTLCISCLRCIQLCPQNARYINPALLSATSLKLEKECTERKQNHLFF